MRLVFVSVVTANTASREAAGMSRCSDVQSVIQIALLSGVMLCSLVGNALLCALLVRFHSLRTVPNILVVNIAVIDIANALVNMPLMILWYVCHVDALAGRPLSLFIVSFYVLTMYLTVFSLLVLMMDRYGAIVHGLRYHTWKTRSKALLAAAAAWAAGLLYTGVEFSTGLDIDVGYAPVATYRKLYFKRFGREFLYPPYVVPFSFILVMAIRMWLHVRKSRRQIADDCHAAGSTRVAAEAQTAQTVCLTIVAYVLMGFLPVFLHSVAKIHGTWTHFLAYLFMHMNSMANPVIYSLRTRRFRKAIALLIKYPTGKSQPK